MSEYRYVLERGPWLNGSGTVLFVMLNPSTADESRDDPTIRRCVAFAQLWGFAGLRVANLYGLRSTDPRGLFGHPDPVGPGNDRELDRLARDATEVIVAWGASRHPDPDRVGCVLDLLESLVGEVRCLGQTKGLHPKHPLYVPRMAARVPFRRMFRSESRSGFACPACGAVMYPARLLKGYEKTGPGAERSTCVLHGPLGPFRHLASDRVGSEGSS